MGKKLINQARLLQWSSSARMTQRRPCAARAIITALQGPRAVDCDLTYSQSLLEVLHIANEWNVARSFKSYVDTVVFFIEHAVFDIGLPLFAMPDLGSACTLHLITQQHSSMSFSALNGRFSDALLPCHQ